MMMKTMNSMAKPTIKYPRVMVSVKRHTALAKEAKLRKMSIQDVAEEKFVHADTTITKTNSGMQQG